MKEDILQILKKELAAIGITTERQLDSALEKSLASCEIGIMTVSLPKNRGDV